MPKWKAGGLSTSVWGGTGFTIYRDSPRADLAWDLLKYTYMTKESQIQRYETLKYFPTMFEALEDPRVVNVTDDYYSGQEVGKIFEQIAPDVPQWYQSPARSPLITALNASLNSFYVGQGTAEQTVDSIVSATQEVMMYL
jgi:maltose-binding protein MalE